MKTRFIIPVLFLIFFSSGSFTSCKEPESTGPETRPDSLTLKVKETDLTSATLSLHTAGITYPASLTLTRNSQPVQTFSLHKPDTTLIDTALTPSTTYTWQVIWKKTETTFLKGEPVTGRTMDTTSHNFTWRLDTLGASGSILRDVAIVNDTCVWVVGDIKSQAYSSVDRYNAAMWNGKVWKKFKIKMKIYNGNTYESPISAIFFHSDDLLSLCSIDGGFAVIDTKGQLKKNILLSSSDARGSINKIWGTSSQNLFFVGTNGSITHYNGSTFTLMESGTTVNLRDVWGTSENEVWACGWSQTSSTVMSVFLALRNGSWKVLTESPVGDPNQHPEEIRDWISSVFAFNSWPRIWISSEWGIFEKGKGDDIKARLILNPSDEFPAPPIGLLNRIRGQSPADLIVVGEFGGIYHFNGSHWYRYLEFLSQDIDYYSVDFKNNRVVATGRNWNENAVILIGKK